jgi:phage terminase large subunit GpA-like protein
MPADSAVLRRILAVLRPPPRGVSHREVAEDLLLPDGPMMGKPYIPDLDPVHAALIRELDNDWHSLVGVGAVQTGKSLALVLVPMLRQVIALRNSCVYSQPTQQKIAEAWTGKVYPSILGAGAAAWLPEKGQGGRGGQTPRFVVFRDPDSGNRAGMLYLIPGGGASEAAQASVTAPTVLVDEVDSFQTAHRVELVGKRADSFGRQARRIYTSTVKHDESEGEDASIILGMYQQSTRSRLYFACPYCGTYQPLEWERVQYDPQDEATVMARDDSGVRYSCPHCDGLWTEPQRQAALRTWRLVHDGQTVGKDGIVVGKVPVTMSFGLLWTALDSSLRDMPTLAAEHLRAELAKRNGDHGPMRSFWRDQLCRNYTGDREGLTTQLRWQGLVLRSSATQWGPALIQTDREHVGSDYLYSRRVADQAPDAPWAVAGVDVQHDRIYWSLLTFNRDQTTYHQAWGYEYGRPDHAAMSQPELHSLLDRVNIVLNRCAGQSQLVLVGLDTGDRADWLLPWLRSQGSASPWRAVKGNTQMTKPEPGDLEGMVFIRDGLFNINVDNVRDALHAALRRPVGQAGASVIPHGLGAQDAHYFRHLVAEQTGLDPKTFKKIIQRSAGRHDWLDCCIYAYALMLGFVRDMRETDRRTAEVQVQHRKVVEARTPETVDRAEERAIRAAPDPAQAEEQPQPRRVESPLTRRDQPPPRQRVGPISGRGLYRVERRYGWGFRSEG